MRIRRRFWPWLTVWTVVGLGIRIGTVVGRPHTPAGGDPFIYYHGALLLLEGKGFIDPFTYIHSHHQIVQSAAYAPGFMVSLTVPMILGFKTWYAARIWSCVISAAAVTVTGFAGKEIGGRRVGLIAAALIALDPNMWMSNEFVGAETIEPLIVAAVILCAYRLWKQTDMRRAAWFGAILGVTMLCRDELALLVVLILVPMCLLARSLSWKKRFSVLGVGLATTVLVVGPWVGYNLERFEKPVFISDGEGVTLASANCADTFSGKFEGYWSMRCALDEAKYIPKGLDESQQGADFQQMTITYIEHHENRLVPVGLAKLGRAFGFFHPMQQISFDALIETRPYHWALVGLGTYYGLFVLSIGGTVILRKRRIPVYPLWAIGLNVALAVLVAFGTTRYRLPFDVALVLMASVTLAWVWQRLWPERARHSVQAHDEEPPRLEEPVPEHV